MSWRMMVIAAGLIGLIALAAERGVAGPVVMGSGAGHVVSAPVVAPARSGAGRVISPPVLWHAPQGNGHLHISPPGKRVFIKSPTPIKKDEVVHPHWHTRWDYAGWVTLHRGLGTITGVVRETGAVGTGRVRLSLRKPGGKTFASAAAKHIVYTNAGGSFMMRNVRMGSYRLMAFLGKRSSHVQIRVNSGAMTEVAVGV